MNLIYKQLDVTLHFTHMNTPHTNPDNVKRLFWVAVATSTPTPTIVASTTPAFAGLTLLLPARIAASTITTTTTTTTTSTIMTVSTAITTKTPTTQTSLFNMDVICRRMALPNMISTAADSAEPNKEG